MSAQQEMLESFDRLVYRVKTTAPHLQSFVDELKEKIELAVSAVAADIHAVMAAAPECVDKPEEESHSEEGK